MSNYLTDLYFGLGYEYHAIGHFWRLGYEAFKINADYGYDLLVHNQKMRDEGAVKESRPCLVQVKAAHVKKGDWDSSKSNAGKRQKANAKFYFKEQHLDKLLENQNAYLLCYFVDSEGDESVLSYFWLSAHHLKQLRDGHDGTNEKAGCQWFLPEKEHPKKVYLSATICRPATLENEYETCMNQLKKWDDEEHQKLIDLFNYYLEKTQLLNLHSSTYVKLDGQTKEGKPFSRKLVTGVMRLRSFQNSTICKELPFDLD